MIVHLLRKIVANVSILTLIVLTLLVKLSSPVNTNAGEKSQGLTKLPFLWYWLRSALRSS